MPKNLLLDGIKFRLWRPDSEANFEPIVKEHSKEIFGENSLYFGIKPELRSNAGIGSKPDGFVIVFDKPAFYVIEVEKGEHGVHDHVVAQISRFNSALKKPETKIKIIKAIHKDIKGNPESEAFAKARIKDELYKFLSELIALPPTVVIVIDELSDELSEAVEELPLQAKIVEFQTFQRENAPTVRAYLFDTLSPFESGRADVIVHVPKAEDDHFKGKEHLRPIYEKLKETMLSLGQDVKVGAPTQYYLPFARRVTFCEVHVKKKWLRLDLKKVKDVTHPKIIPYHVGEWVYVHVEKKSDIDEIIEVIKKAYERAA